MREDNATQTQRERYHILKTDPDVFQAVLSGAKTFEIRLNDRGYAVGDVLGLRETKHTGAEMRAGAPLEYTGRECQRFVSHVLTGYGLADGWCCLSFRLPHAAGESVPVASAEVMDALNWVDDFIARCNRDDRGSCESVNVLRRALASAPVAEQAALFAQSTTKDDKAALGMLECGKPLCALGEHHPLCRNGWAEKKGASAPTPKPWPVEEQPDGTVTPVGPVDLACAPVACNCPGGNKPVDLHAPNCPVRTAKATLIDPYDGGTWLASAPVAGEAQPSDADITNTIRALDDQARYTRDVDGEMGVRVKDVMIARAVLARYGHTPLPMADAAPQARPSDDKLWDQTLGERDEYHDMADKLANAIADHLLIEIGEHTSSNCPWTRALEAIENAAPQASAQDEWKAAIRKFIDTAIPALAAIADVHTPDEIDALDAMPREPVIDQVRRLSHACEELSRQVRPERPKADEGGARCACPSRDGSLRHPCAAHPAKASGNGGEEWSDS
ncbi:DUF3850 domain-containing protein [Achromobacter xylosoxidans]|uniref:DUF3850 domain-containing protein n=1 Tax=Alcaligenes xylosoxydans xylosoxydans TaxID=85698 RepID=UPI001C9E8585|nr:DUF3850 domain-containing protein [Achromobacter xylosoxidans]